MEKERVLVHENTGGQQTFLKAVEAGKDAANGLIQTYESFQEFQRISTLTEFESLCLDPVKYFDATITANAKLSMTGGRLPDPQILADLFGLDRLNYSQIILGLPVTAEGCVPCHKLNVVKRAGKPALTYSKFAMYKDYMTFDSGVFSLNTEAILGHLEDFKTYASTPAQLDILNRWQALVDLLNKRDETHGMTTTDKQLLKKIFGLSLSNGMDGIFGLDSEVIKNEILKTI